MQLKRQEETNAELDLSMSALDQRLANAESKITTLEVDNQSLRRDKEILTDHVADLQKQVSRTLYVHTSVHERTLGSSKQSLVNEHQSGYMGYQL